jgi:hypothetical protein
MGNDRWWRNRGIPALLGAILAIPIGPAVCAAQNAPVQNRFNDELTKLPPDQQAAKLADHLGLWCVGAKPFFMGMTKGGRAKGYAYWSVTCAGAGSYMIQITPQGLGGAVDCNTLKEEGQGRECYKSF